MNAVIASCSGFASSRYILLSLQSDLIVHHLLAFTHLVG